MWLSVVPIYSGTFSQSSSFFVVISQIILGKKNSAGSADGIDTTKVLDSRPQGIVPYRVLDIQQRLLFTASDYCNIGHEVLLLDYARPSPW